MYLKLETMNILKQKYKKVLECSIMISLLIVTFLLYSFKSFDNDFSTPIAPIIDFEIDFVEPIKPDLPKPPAKPPVPVESEIDEPWSPDLEFLPKKGFLASLGDPPPPPPLDEPDVWEFEVVEEKPVLLKHVQPYYPEIARKAGVEGTVVVKVLIDKNGSVEKAEIFKSIPVLDNAALQAAMKCIFQPAKQRDKNVKVWMFIPFKFKLQ